MLKQTRQKPLLYFRHSDRAKQTIQTQIRGKMWRLILGYTVCYSSSTLTHQHLVKYSSFLFVLEVGYRNIALHAGKNLVDDILKYFSYFLFPRKQALSFHRETICMKCRNLFSEETICMKCLSLYSWKSKKTIIHLLSAELAQGVVKVKAYECLG